MPESINIEPHWPGMCRWLEQVGRDLSPVRGMGPYGVAILGGDDTAMVMVYGDLVFEFTGGELVERPDLSWHDVQEQAFCYRSQMAGKGTVVKGEWVED